MKHRFDTLQQLMDAWLCSNEEFASAYRAISQCAPDTGSKVDLLQEIDSLATEYFPLPKHFAADRDVHTRKIYATLLAAISMRRGVLGADQRRLYGMLLIALGLPDAQAELLALVSKLQRNDLKEFFRLLTDTELAKSFLLDAMILCRLEGPLTEEQDQLLSEMAGFLNVDKKHFLVIGFFAARVLGLPFDSSILPDELLKSIYVVDSIKQLDVAQDFYVKKLVFSGCKFVESGDVLFDGSIEPDPVYL